MRSRGDSVLSLISCRVPAQSDSRMGRRCLRARLPVAHPVQSAKQVPIVPGRPLQHEYGEDSNRSGGRLGDR
jgi:hypothetical protein